MFRVDSDGVIHLTRGDVGSLTVNAIIEGNGAYTFKPGDIVRLSVCERKNCNNVVMECNALVTVASEVVELVLEASDTSFGGVISKPVEYWYEIALNPDTFKQTIVPYDQDGARVLILYPGFSKIHEIEPPDTVEVGANLKGLTVSFAQEGGVSGAGYEVMFKAGDDFEIFSEDDTYSVMIDGVTEVHGTGYFNAFIYTFPTDKDYIVSVYDKSALSATIIKEGK